MKKKVFKVILAVVLSLVMVLGMTGTAVAEKPDRQLDVSLQYETLPLQKYRIYAHTYFNDYRIYGFCGKWYLYNWSSEEWVYQYTILWLNDDGLVEPDGIWRDLSGPTGRPGGEKWLLELTFLRKNDRPWGKPTVSASLTLPFVI